MNRYLLDLVLSLILKQLIRFRESIKWMEVRLYVDRKVREIVPGVWLDNAAVAAAMFVVDGAARALQDTADVKSLLDAVARASWEEALDTFKELLADNWKWPAENKVQEKVLKLLGVDTKPKKAGKAEKVAASSDAKDPVA